MSDKPSIDSIFCSAIEIESPDERQAFVERACGPDADLKQQVERLLYAHFHGRGILDLPASAPVVTASEQPARECPGTVIGHYKLLEEIGEGGFGVVYLAEQTQPVRRRVALKVLKPGMDTKQVVARFEAERQALALMDHPNIAQVHDGGTTPDGRPYFVKELVKGIPITDYCDQCQLPMRERLELFLAVCQAVQHAHQKGVIHRDLKPSNVLVAMQDGKPTVKLIDFGVAKALGQRLSEQTLVTGFHQMIGTPLYMSPEQAELSPLDVDTRADIYALGVLLYELLTGTTPFEKERLSKVGYDELRRIIREEEPPRPSVRLSTLQDRLSTVAAQRRTEPRHLIRTVRGELDWMVMKCLEKDRNRRYETASAFAQDVQRYLADEPVLACPPSAGYRLRKFARRHLGALLVAGVLALASLLAVGSLAVAAVVLGQSNTQVKQALAEKTEAFDDLQTQKKKTDDALAREQKALRYLQAEERRTKLALSHHTIALADREWWLSNLGKAEELLDAVPDEFRHWEWHYLKRRCHRELLVLRGHTGRVYLVGYSANGKDILTASMDGTLRVWDATTGTQRRQLAVPRECKVLAVSADGTRAVLGGRREDESILFWVWDTATGREVFATKALPPRSKPYAAAFSPDSQRLAVGTFPFRVTIFDLTTGREEMNVDPDDFQPARGLRGVLRLAFSPDGKWLAAILSVERTQAGEPTQGVSTLVLIWDTTTGKPLPQLRRISAATLGLEFSPDGRSLAALLGSGEAVIFRVHGGQPLTRLQNVAEDDTLLEEHFSGPIHYSPDGKLLVTGGLDGTMRFWDPAGRLVRILRAHTDKVSSIAFSSDGHRLASASHDYTVKVWNVQGSQQETVLSPRSTAPSPVGPLAIAPDGRRFAGGPLKKPDAPCEIRVWDDTGGKEVTIPCGTNEVTGLHFSPGGQYLVATLLFTKPNGTEKMVKAYDAITGREHFSSPALHPNTIYLLAFSRDGRRLVVAQRSRLENEMKVLDADSLKELTTIPLGPNVMTSPLELSHDGRFLSVSVRGLGKNGLQVWDTASGTISLTIPFGDQWVTDVTFSPDGQQLAAGTEDGTVTLWERATGRQLHELRAHRGSAQVAFSPDGKRLATIGVDKRAKLWDPATGRAVLTLPPGHRSIPYFNWVGSRLVQLGFSPDGAQLMLIGSGGGVIWDGTPWKEETAR